MRIQNLVAVLAASPLLAACAGAPVAPEAAAPAVPRYTIEQLMDTKRVAGASFSPDGATVAFSSNRSGVFNVYAQPVAGGEAEPLTASTGDAIFSLGFFPKKTAGCCIAATEAATNSTTSTSARPTAQCAT